MYDILFLILSIIVVICLLEKKEHFVSDMFTFKKDFVDYGNKNLDLEKTYQSIYANMEQNIQKESMLDDFKKIYYNVPIGDVNYSNKILDKSVLKNYREIKDFNTYSKDIDYEQVQKIIGDINKNTKFKLKSLGIENIGQQFVDVFNEKFEKLDLNNDYHKKDTRKYELFGFRTLLRKNIIGYEYQFVYDIKIYKENKNYGFTFQNTINLDEEKLTIQYINIDLVGIVSEEDFVFRKNEGEFKCKFDTDINKDECFELNYGRQKDINKSDFISGKHMEDIIKKAEEDREEEKELDRKYQQFRCFGRSGFNESECRSYDVKRKTVGVWDKPCEKNEECPFFQENKNYTNNRGGCIEGTCELPVNLDIIGFRYYNNNQKPFCYNCDIDNCKGEKCYTCCEEQKDRSKYPNLKSPDYMFLNDYSERQ